MTPWRHVTLLALLTLVGASLALVTSTAPAFAAPVVGDTPSASWRVNGRVYATQVVGNTVIVGGAFTTATSPSGETVARRNLAAFRMSDGELLRGWTADAGSTVRAIETDGTWLYVGGAFGRVGGVTAGRLARVRVADAWVDPAFRVSADSTVRALDLRSGALWVGGVFLHVNGVARQRVARLNPTTGAVDPSFNPVVNNDVWGIVKNPTSDTVYVSGTFSGAGGGARAGVAALDASTGGLRATVFTSSARPTLGLDVNDAGTRLFGAGGSGANTMAAWSTSTGARVWRHVAMGDIQAVTHHKGKVFFGFHDGFDGDTRIKVLAADEATGALDSAFRPRFNSFWGVHAIGASDAGVVVGGEFTVVSGVAAQGWARFPATGTTTPVDPAPGDPVPVTTPFFGTGADWRWYYRTTAPGTGWATPAFDDSAWGSGAGALGFGAAEVVTGIDTFATPGERPVTAYFRRTVQITDLSRVVSLDLSGVANDGAVVHVNGVEVARQNMRDGAVTHTTYAPTARRHAVAAATPLVVSVPRSALVEGANVIAVETHLNYRATPDVTFGMTASLTRR